MFGLFKKKKEEKPAEQERPNGIPGTAVQMILNPCMKNVERLDVNIGEAGCDIHRLISSISSLLKKKRISTICISGDRIIERFDDIKDMLEIAAAYNIENRMLCEEELDTGNLPIDEILNYGVSAVVVKDGLKEPGTIRKDDRELRVLPWESQAELQPEAVRLCGKGPLSQKLDDVRYLAVEPDGTVRVCGFPIGNLFEMELVDIIEEYDPYSNPIMAMIIQGGPDAVSALCTEEELPMERCERCRAVVSRLFS